MERHTAHILLGKDMASISEAISNHIDRHGSSSIKDYVHILTFSENVICEINKPDKRKELTDDVVGKNYFEEFFIQTISIGKTIANTNAELYVCIHVQLYDDEQIKRLGLLSKWIKLSQKPYIVDVCGISYDLAKVFCSSQKEKEQLVYKIENYIDRTKQSVDYVVDELQHNSFTNRLLLLQNQNISGIGLNLDKDTLIRILGEFIVLVSENYYDFFPVHDVENHEVVSFGLSALWFNRLFYDDFLLTNLLITVFDREKIGCKELANPIDILQKARIFIGKYSGLFKSFYESLTTPSIQNDEHKQNNEEEICQEFNAHIGQFEEELKTFLNDQSFLMNEKKLFLALLLREDDEMMNDAFSIEEDISIDDCIKDAIDLYVDENNRIIDDTHNSVLSSPLDEKGHIYNPIDSIKQLKNKIRKSKKFIRQSEKRLEELTESAKIDFNSKKVYPHGEFVYGNTTYKLLHDVVEEPLEDTYTPKIPAAKSVDLRKLFSPVRSQGELGACTAFSASSIFEYILNSHKESSSCILSPRFLYYNVCDKNIDGTPIDNGSSYLKIIQSLGEHGICYEELCPYTSDFGEEPSEAAKSDALTRLVTQAMNVKLVHTDITSALTEGYPVAISLKLYSSFHQPVKGFVFRPSEVELNSGDFEGWHAMVICGYSEKEKVYIVRNSWGDDFGDNGYCYIPFSYIEDPDLCSHACIITGVSCGEVHNNEVVKDVDFDKNSKDIEYAVLRILIDEEKGILRDLEKEYNLQQGYYIRLLAELSNSNKRDLIREHACRIKKSDEITIAKDSSSKASSISRWIFAIPAIGTASAGILNYFDKLSYESSIALSGVSIIGGGLCYYFSKKQNNSRHSAIENHDKGILSLHDSELLQEKIKYRLAGILIDRYKEIRSVVEREHRKITSFLLNLNEWSIQNKKKQSEISDKLKDPFVSIFSDNEFEKILNYYGEKYTRNIFLWNMFADYTIEGEAIRLFYEVLKTILLEKIHSSYGGFSMVQYIMSKSQEPFTLSLERKQELLTRIDLQSLPFVEHITGKPNKQVRRLLFVESENNIEKQKFEEFCKINFSNSPSCCYGGTIYKLTFVQILGCDRKELKMYKSYN